MRSLAFVLVAVIAAGCLKPPSAPKSAAKVELQDPLFDKVTKGMPKEEVFRLLGTKTWTEVVGDAAIWTFPRKTLEEHHANPDRNWETQDVLFVYFRDGKVWDIQRATGEEFRQPRPK